MQRNAKPRAVLSDFDKIVAAQVQKSVVVAPSDPNGGTKLPVRQSDKAKQKGKGKTQYMAVFDREAGESDDQLDDWMDDTNGATQSPDHFVNEDDDEPEDPDDEEWEDARGSEVYDPYGDDDEMDDNELEALDLPDDDEENEYVKVRGHKRRKVRKANVADDDEEDFADLSDDDDDDDEHGDDDDNDDDEKKDKAEKDDKRRRKVRKALGVDAMKYVDGNPLVKALTDAVFDMTEGLQGEIRSMRLENKKLHARMNKMVQRENRQMAKALVTSQAQFAGYPPEEVAPAQVGRPVRKAYGMPVATTQRPVQQDFNLAKALDVVEKGFTDGAEGIRSNDVTILELDGRPEQLSRAAQELLRKEGVNW